MKHEELLRTGSAVALLLCESLSKAAQAFGLVASALSETAQRNSEEDGVRR